MIPLRFARVEIRQPRYDPHPEKSKTNNSAWRVGLFVIFTDYDGKEYDYMPKWADLLEIEKCRETVEQRNKDLARQHFPS